MQPNSNIRNSLLIILAGVVLFSVVLLVKNKTSFWKLEQAATMEVKIPTEVKENLQITEPQPEYLLPDIQVKPPKTLYIQGSGENKRLRFDTTFVNLGPGALEIIGHSDPTGGKTYAAQYLFAKGEPGDYRDIGTFEYHDTHNHWHVQNYVSYQLWAVNEQGEKGQMVTDTGKMSFCIWDQHSNDLKIENAPQTRMYGYTCARNIQGMSVGWGDTYEANVDDQELNISSIADGDYILSYEVNPERKVLEKDYSNNRGEMKIRISGSRISVL